MFEIHDKISTFYGPLDIIRILLDRSCRKDIEKKHFRILKEKFTTLKQKAVSRGLELTWIPSDQWHSKFHKIIFDASSLKVSSIYKS